MNAADANRELAKVENVLAQVERHLAAHNESMAALHLSEQVMQSPLTVAVVQARSNLQRLQVRLENEGVSNRSYSLIETGPASAGFSEIRVPDSRIWEGQE